MIFKPHVWEIDLPYSTYFISTDQDSSISENQRSNLNTSNSVFLNFFNLIRKIRPVEYNAKLNSNSQNDITFAYLRKNAIYFINMTVV